MANNSDFNSKLNFAPSVSQEMYTTSYSMRSADPNIDPSTTFEVFRNNTTAVEVIVKEVPTKTKKTINQRTVETTKCLYETQTEKNDLKSKKMRDEIEQLKSEVYLANRRYFTVKRDLKCLVLELKKQLDLMSQRELEEQTKSLALQLEKEKLQTLSDSQSVIISRLKKELNHLKRTLKFVVKGISIAPQVSNNVTYGSDIEYDDFEKGLKKENLVKFATNIDGLASADTGAFDSTFHSFDKI